MFFPRRVVCDSARYKVEKHYKSSARPVQFRIRFLNLTLVANVCRLHLRAISSSIVVMYEELEKRIDEQEVWTFRECLGLAVDFGLKTRMVIAQVLMQGKEYVDHENDQQG